MHAPLVQRIEQLRKEHMPMCRIAAIDTNGTVQEEKSCHYTQYIYIALPVTITGDDAYTT